MGFPKVKGGMSTQGDHPMTPKNRAKFVKKVAVQSLKQMSTEKKGL